MKRCEKCCLSFTKKNEKFCSVCGDKLVDGLKEVKTKMYLHGDPDSNWEEGENLGLTGSALEEFARGTLYEVEFDLIVNVKTGNVMCEAVNGRKLESPVEV
jgi:hypothetical protein